MFFKVNVSKTVYISQHFFNIHFHGRLLSLCFKNKLNFVYTMLLVATITLYNDKLAKYLCTSLTYPE